MKIRNGFVSNSSSSSFVLKKKGLSELHRIMILNHIECGKIFKQFKIQLANKCYVDAFWGWCQKEDKWEIEESDKEIIGYTDLTNFDMEAFFKIIGINAEAYEFKR